MTILHLDSSITGDASVSRQLSRAVVERLVAEDRSHTVVRRDLVTQPLEHLTMPAFADTSVIEEFLAADTIVIGAPMYNFGIPSQLKAWLDRILVAGQTFRYTATGPEGLVGSKRVIVAVSRGGFYHSGSPTEAFEHVETYLTKVFSFIGIRPEFVAADGIAIGPEQREQGIATGLAAVERLAA